MIFLNGKFIHNRSSTCSTTLMENLACPITILTFESDSTPRSLKLDAKYEDLTFIGPVQLVGNIPEPEAEGKQVDIQAGLK